MKIESDKVVRIHYTLKDSDGNAIDSSEGGEPLSYLHGAKNIVPGLERALEGRITGDNFDVSVSAGEGYGEYDPALKQTVSREAFDGMDVEIGAQFQASTDQGPVSVIVTDVSDHEVTVDGNHPLAGHELFFQIEVVDIRDASAEEIDHGHVH